VPISVIFSGIHAAEGRHIERKVGAAPLPAVGVTRPVVGRHRVAPATTFSSLAQMAAFTCTARARMAA
jgi:hypothetical protein